MKKQAAFEHTIPAVEKTVLLLNALVHAGTGMSHAELSRVCAITQSTCYRILCTLLNAGWLEKAADGTFDLAPGMMPLALAVCCRSGEHWEQLQQVLDELSAKTGLSCKFSIRENEEQVVIARAESPGPFSISGKTGARFPLAEGSVGAALLADATAEELDELLSHTKASIPEKQDPALLREAVASVRKNGYALNTQKNRWHIGALSVPVRNASGHVAAALTLLGPEDDFSRKMLLRHLSALRASQDRISCKHNP